MKNNYKNICLAFLLSFLSFNQTIAWGCEIGQCGIDEEIYVKFSWPKVLEARSLTGKKNQKIKNSTLPTEWVIKEGKIEGAYLLKTHDAAVYHFDVEELAPAYPGNKVDFGTEELSDFKKLAEQGYVLVPFNIFNRQSNCVSVSAFIVKTSVEEAREVSKLLIEYGIDEITVDVNCTIVEKRKEWWFSDEKKN